MFKGLFRPHQREQLPTGQDEAATDRDPAAAVGGESAISARALILSFSLRPSSIV